MIRLTRSQSLKTLSVNPAHIAFIEHQDVGCLLWLTQGYAIAIVEQAAQIERLAALWRDGAPVSLGYRVVAIELDGEGTPTWVTA